VPLQVSGCQHAYDYKAKSNCRAEVSFTIEKLVVVLFAFYEYAAETVACDNDSYADQYPVYDV
jgi:hypothetical protein